MTLQIQTELTDETTMCLILNGKLDTITAPELDKLISNKLVPKIKNLVLDLQTLNFVSSAGLRVFAKARKMIKLRNGKIYFINLSPQVKKVFDIVKAVPLSEVFQNTKELDAYLVTMQDKERDF